MIVQATFPWELYKNEYETKFDIRMGKISLISIDASVCGECKNIPFRHKCDRYMGALLCEPGAPE